jgi:hypothetical protein
VGLGQEVAARPHGVGDVQGQRLIRHPDLSHHLLHDAEDLTAHQHPLVGPDATPIQEPDAQKHIEHNRGPGLRTGSYYICEVFGGKFDLFLTPV